MGVESLSIRRSERLADNDIVASVGSKGDSFDDAMAESFNWLYKWELMYQQGPWRGFDEVEFATLLTWTQRPTCWPVSARSYGVFSAERHVDGRSGMR
jgi:transposase InsO family protein